MIKRLERLKNTVNKYMADLQPDQLTIYQSERKLVKVVDLVYRELNKCPSYVKCFVFRNLKNSKILQIWQLC
jgi:hypothetical protein